MRKERKERRRRRKRKEKRKRKGTKQETSYQLKKTAHTKESAFEYSKPFPLI